MFSRLARKSYHSATCLQTLGLRRFASDSTKSAKAKSNTRLFIILAISGPVCYGAVEYARDIRFHELIDEKVLSYAPWFMKKFNEWFPVDLSTPYKIRRAGAPLELKKVLSEAFTEIDLMQKDGFTRANGVEFVKMAINGNIPIEVFDKFKNGEYLNYCMHDLAHKDYAAVAGLDIIMSIDEFIVFASEALRGANKPVNELCESVQNAQKQYCELHQLKQREEYDETHFDFESPFKSLTVPLVRTMISDRYKLNEEEIEKFNSNKVRILTTNAKREELEHEIGVIQWDLDQIYEEIKEEKQRNDPESAERVKELYETINELKKQKKDVQNELYYL